MRAITSIVLHCSATPQGHQVTVQDVDRWHAARGFRRTHVNSATFNPSLKSIGYHFLIDLGGQVFTGRSVDEIGAHVAGSNSNSIGVCMVGMQRFTLAQWAALRSVVTTLQGVYPGAKVLGHRDHSPDTNGNGVIEPFEWLKECPTFDVASWLKGGMQPLQMHTVRN